MLTTTKKFIPMKFKNVSSCECFMWKGKLFVKLLEEDAEGRPIPYNAMEDIGLLRTFEPDTEVLWVPSAHIEI